MNYLTKEHQNHKTIHKMAGVAFTYMKVQAIRIITSLLFPTKYNLNNDFG